MVCLARSCLCKNYILITNLESERKSRLELKQLPAGWYTVVSSQHCNVGKFKCSVIKTGAIMSVSGKNRRVAEYDGFVFACFIALFI